MISVVIINYNTFQLTCNCIESVILHTKEIAYEIILVDNNSTECDADLFLQRFPQIILVKNTNNGGFAQGNNAGIAQAKGTTILLLNSDTRLTEDSIYRSAQVLQANKSIGVLGIRMVYPNGTIQHTARKFRSISWELLDLFRFIPLLMPYQYRAKRMLGKYFRGDFDTRCDWVNGAYFMFPVSILENMPGHKLDERFFMYGEDHLWCYHIQQAGYMAYFYSATTIIHINNGSTRKEKQLKLIPVMIRHEQEIMKERVGKGIYYYLFCSIYLSKEYGRYAIKWLVYIMAGKLVR